MTPVHPSVLMLVFLNVKKTEPKPKQNWSKLKVGFLGSRYPLSIPNPLVHSAAVMIVTSCVQRFINYMEVQAVAILDHLRHVHYVLHDFLSWYPWKNFLKKFFF